MVSIIRPREDDPVVVEQSNSTSAPTFAQYVRSKVQHLEKRSQENQRPAVQGITPRQSANNVPLNNGRRNSTILYGDGPGDSRTLGNNLSADIDLVATGVNKAATEVQLKEFLEGNGVKVEAVECLTVFHLETARTKTFKVTVKSTEYDKVMNPNVWPYRVGVRHFKQKRSQQFTQRGGSIFLQPASHQQQSQNIYQIPQ